MEARHPATLLVDPLLRIVLKDEKFKRRLVRQASPQAGERILDVGCGIGTLAIMLKHSCPDSEVVGLDGDPEALEIARQNIARMGLAIELRYGMTFDPPLERGSFHKVVSSLALHHLTTRDKRRALVTIFALLRPGGELHIADWGKAQNLIMRTAFLGVQLADGFESTTDNVRGHLVPLMREAGFSHAEETHREMTLLGTLALYRATKGLKE